MSRRKTSSRDLRPDEQTLWQTVTKNFKPLQKPETLSARPALNQDNSDVTVPAPLRSALKSSVAASPLPSTSLKAVDRSGERKVRRGRVEIEGRIDLHGMTVAKARRSLLRFLRRAHGDHKRVVLVITGKGVGKRALDDRQFEPWSHDIAPLPGVLRRSFGQWMQEAEFSQIVSGFSPAHQRHGGAGAFYVMLRA
jgi:DNA-nicking Smr family endonuclease